jgi:4-hydroxy-tetrahydrodipicolinate synthase
MGNPAVTGVLPAILTPFTDGEVDLGLLGEHVDWLHDRGIRCVNLMGTTGEGQSLALQERERLIRFLADSKLDFIAGTGCLALPETIALSRYAVEHGARAALVVPPSYFDPGDLTGWFTALFEALPDHARVMLYHIPRLTYPIADETIRLLSDRFGPMLAGMKDSSGDLDHALRWQAEFPELTVANGNDAHAAGFFAGGGHAVITACSNVLPAELEALRAGDESPQDFVAGVRELVFSLPTHAALKLLLHLVSGIARSSVRPPLAELTREQETLVATRFAELRSA